LKKRGKGVFEQSSGKRSFQFLLKKKKTRGRSMKKYRERGEPRAKEKTQNPPKDRREEACFLDKK